MAPDARERILIVESDPLISDMLARQALQAAGYQVVVVTDASAAIGRAMQLSPDVIIVNLNLQGLSGKDLLVALNSQNVETPVIILAKKGMEGDIIQAFRLGASDYLLWPVREPEVISVVERVLRQVRERRERERLSKQLQQTNQELQSRVRELTTIFAIGKAVTSITDQTMLFEKILDGAIKVTQAEMGWFLQRSDPTKPAVLMAQRNLPPSLAGLLNTPWDDGISSLVAMSGETLTIHGEPIKRFKIATLGQAALISPIKVQKQVVGLLVMLRKPPQPFSPSEQHLLEAVADYASISLVNARLFRTVEERALSLQTQADSALAGEKINIEILQKVKGELRFPLDLASNSLTRLTKDPTARWNNDQRQILSHLQEQLDTLGRVTEAITQPTAVHGPHSTAAINLNDLVRLSTARFQRFAQQNRLTLNTDLPTDPLFAQVDPVQISQVLEGLLSNAIKFCNPGGHVQVRLERSPDRQVHFVVSDSGGGLDPGMVAHVFDPRFRPQQTGPRRFGGLGIGLSLIKDIITQQNGKIWAESKPGQATHFHITLPITRQTGAA